jgi:hypothetical protein
MIHNRQQTFKSSKREENKQGNKRNTEEEVKKGEQ